MSVKLIVTRTIRAPRQRVFDAFIKPELRRQWWFPEEGMVCDVCEIDARPGGRYRVNMKDARSDETKEWCCTGQFEELVGNERIVFSWTWEHAETLTSLVTVELTEADGGTEVRIVHERLEDDADRAGHEQGWVGCLASLARAIE